MFEILFRRQRDFLRHRIGPLALERERYIHHCGDHGATDREQRKRARCLLWLSKRMAPSDRQGVNAARLRRIVYRRPAPGPSMAMVFVEFGRPWLKFLGWWREQKDPVPSVHFAQQYVTWMRDERGLSPVTISVRRRRIENFLRWCGKTDRDFSSLRPEDLDAYFATFADQWSRRSAATMAEGLRTFLRYAASNGSCRRGLSETIQIPRWYKLESLPYALTWEDVRRLLAMSSASSSAQGIRDHAILMLLAIYGLRRGEIATLRLDQIDWRQRRMSIHRLKRRQPQVYPLQRSVAEALSRYIESVRPTVPYPQIFITLHAPRRPITGGAIYHIVSERLRSLGIEAAHFGPHALRHSCAAKLLASKMTLKEIGDHLGHRSTAATMIYTKVDLDALREVGDFDLGELP